MDEVQTLINRANEKLNAAKKILSLNLIENSLSRLYYSQFFGVRALLRFIENDAKTHRGVIDQFSLNFVKSEKIDKKYLTLISSPKQMRESADYGIYVDFYEEKISPIVKMTEEMLIDIEEYMKKSR